MSVHEPTVKGTRTTREETRKEGIIKYLSTLRCQDDAYLRTLRSRIIIDH